MRRVTTTPRTRCRVLPGSGRVWFAWLPKLSSDTPSLYCVDSVRLAICTPLLYCVDSARLAISLTKLYKSRSITDAHYHLLSYSPSFLPVPRPLSPQLITLCSARKYEYVISSSPYLFPVQVNVTCRARDLSPLLMLKAIYQIQARQGATALWKGFTCHMMMEGLQLTTDSCISHVTDLPKELPGRVS